MRKQLYLSLLLLLSPKASLFSTPSAGKEPAEIRIHLSTASSLQPIYVGRIFQEDYSFPASYMKDLSSVMDFDFSHNGKTKLLTRLEDKEKTLSSKDLQKALDTQEWRKSSAAVAVRLAVKEKKLFASFLNTQKGAVKSLPEMLLSGNLSTDRRIIHRLADTIFKDIFQEDGIANSRILFSFQRAHASDPMQSISEIWECDWDGANAHAVTGEHTYCVTPVLIPKGGHFTKDMFLYVSYKSGQPKIFISSLDKGPGMKAVDLRGNQLLPAISRQRDKMAFICDASGRADLFVQPIKPENGRMGTPVQLFSYPRSTQASPTFSPDGKKIAFASDKDGSTRIYIIPSERSDKRAAAQLISKKNRENSCPSWSADGTKLAYSAKTDGIRQIWIYDFISGEETQLTSGSGNKENPCWASNSMHLVFNSTDSDTSDLYMVNLNQPEAIKITQGPGKKHYPTWGPR